MIITTDNNGLEIVVQTLDEYRDTLALATECGIEEGKNWRLREDLRLAAARSDEFPDWKPNLDLGEGEARPPEVRYRQRLLDTWKVTWTQIDEQCLKPRNKTVEDRITTLNIIINQHITEQQRIVEEEMKNLWDEGVKHATVQLAEVGLKPKRVEFTNLSDLILQQRDNVEDIALEVRGKVRQSLRIYKASDTYGQAPTKT